METLPEKAALAALARSAAAGDRDAFHTWLMRTHRVVFGVAFKMLGSKADAEDVVQQTYVRAWQGMAELRDMDASLGWVCGIARHVALDRHRSNARHPARSLDEPSEDGAPRQDLPAASTLPADEVMMAASRKKAVHQALAELDGDHRDVLVLREMQGLSYEDVAQALGVPVGTVESRVHRARLALGKKLKRLLGKDGA